MMMAPATETAAAAALTPFSLANTHTHTLIYVFIRRIHKNPCVLSAELIMTNVSIMLLLSFVSDSPSILATLRALLVAWHCP